MFTWGFVYWLSFFILLIFGGFGIYRSSPDNRVYWGGSALGFFWLFFVLGMIVVGSPVPSNTGTHQQHVESNR